jgi:hypothetical protein
MKRDMVNRAPTTPLATRAPLLRQEGKYLDTPLLFKEGWREVPGWLNTQYHVTPYHVTQYHVTPYHVTLSRRMKS